MIKSKILIADNQPIVRQGLIQLISRESYLHLCGETDNAESALRLIEDLKPEVVILDIAITDGAGFEFIKEISSGYPEISILVFSAYEESIISERILRAGAMGYLMKTEKVEEIINAINSLLRGDIYLSRRMRSKVIKRIIGKDNSDDISPIDKLSHRESEVFHLIGEGLSTKRIAERLGLSVKTVETHRTHIKKKLNFRDSAELTQYAIRYLLN